MSVDLQELIARRAYEIWEREGHPHGRSWQHWLQAEAELRGEAPGLHMLDPYSYEMTPTDVPNQPSASPPLCKD